MSRTLFGNENFTTENIKNDDGVSLGQLADELYTAEVLAAYQETDIEADETVELVANATTESLEAITIALAKREDITALTYESYVNTINSASKILADSLRVESIKTEDFDEKKEEVLADLETTVEGFINNITTAIGRVSRKISNTTKNLITTISTRQKVLGKMADKLRNKMDGVTPGDVADKKVRVPKTTARWFADPSDAMSKLKTYTGLRKELPNIDSKLRSIPDLLLDDAYDYKAMYELLASSLDDLGKAPGVKVENIKAENNEVVSLKIPSTLDSSMLWSITKVGANAFLSAAAVGGIATALGFYSPPALVFLPATAAVMYGATKIVNFVFKKKLPVMEWNDIRNTLDSITSMSEVKLTLKGVSAMLAKLEKIGKHYSDAGADKKTAKKQYKAIIKLTSLYATIYRDIYSKSVTCARAAMGYATASLKVHMKSSATQENIKEDPFYQDLNLVNSTFNELDNMLSI